MYYSPYITGVVKLRKFGWGGDMKHVWRGEVLIGFWWGHLMERDNLEDIGVDR
jgi:hypothetical protein